MRHDSGEPRKRQPSDRSRHQRPRVVGFHVYAVCRAENPQTESRPAVARGLGGGWGAAELGDDR